jgi:small subunit ribosomal protein S16
MPVKLRLQRHGKKDNAFFHIIVADGRAPRDGKFIEKLGTYNPTSNPATIDINFEKAMQWLDNGAEPTNTCRAILSYKGVLYKRHLMGGVKKGALTAEQAEAKFQKWVNEKEGKINTKKEKLATEGKDSLSKKHAAEKVIKETKAAKIAAKLSAPPAENTTAETTTEETNG